MTRRELLNILGAVYTCCICIYIRIYAHAYIGSIILLETVRDRHQHGGCIKSSVHLDMR